jgi:uncharacterized RDD family membrane protein YckC
MEPSDEEKNTKLDLVIAKWSDRFFAWLIDYVIVMGGSFVIYLVAFSAANLHAIFGRNFEYTKTLEFWPISLVFFGYWIVLELISGQSIGKRALNIKIVNLRGEPADWKGIVISSFGKAFILPIDVILGWIFTNKKRQRIFNRLGNTIVIKLPKAKEFDDISYKLD